MIIIDDKNKLKHVYLPKPVANDDIEVKFICTGLTDNKQYSTMLYDGDLFYRMKDYYSFVLDLRKWPEQEYKYELYTDKDKFLGSGLMRIGVRNHQEKHNKIKDITTIL